MDYPEYPSNEYSLNQVPSYPPYPTPAGFGMPEMMPPPPQPVIQPPMASMVSLYWWFKIEVIEQYNWDVWTVEHL